MGQSLLCTRQSQKTFHNGIFRCCVIFREVSFLDRSGNIPMDGLYGLDDDAEGCIAINLLPLVVRKYSKRTALSAYTER